MKGLIERRTMRLDIRDAPVAQGNRMRFEGYANLWNVVNPFYKERTLRGAYIKTLQEGGRNVPLNVGHGMQAGYLEDGREDNKGLFIVGALNLDTQAGRETGAFIEQSFEVGRPMGLSREFIAIKERTGKDGVREILEEALLGMAVTPYQSQLPATITSTRDALAYFRGMGIDLTPAQEALALQRMMQAAGIPAESDDHSADDEDESESRLRSVAEALRRAVELIRK